MYNLLICDDDPDIVNALKIYLSDPNYRLFDAANGLEALALLQNNEIHLVLMDIMMPKLDGISAMVKMREVSNVPILLISAKSEDADKILGLQVGADDYITKPFQPAEVAARVASNLRRYMLLGSAVPKADTFCAGPICLDDSQKQVTRDGEPVNLTPTEYEILKLLIQSPGKVFSPKEIYRQIWKQEPLSADNTIAVHIRHLREKLELDPAEPRYLKAIWGHGYKMEGGAK